MTHAAFIALINNQSFATDFNAIGNLIAHYISILIIFIFHFLLEISIKCTQIFNNAHITSSFILFLGIVCIGIKFLESCDYWIKMTEIEEQLRYLNAKSTFQERNIEFLLDQQAINELKITKFIKQMKKLQKEVNEYA